MGSKTVMTEWCDWCGEIVPVQSYKYGPPAGRAGLSRAELCTKCAEDLTRLIESFIDLHRKAPRKHYIMSSKAVKSKWCDIRAFCQTREVNNG